MSNCNDAPLNFKCDYRKQALEVINNAKKRRKRRSLDAISERLRRTMRPTQPLRGQSRNTTTMSTNPNLQTTRLVTPPIRTTTSTTGFTIPTTRFTTQTTDDNQSTDPPTIEELANRFCEFRDDGDFGFPIFCNVYVTCDRFRDGSPRATFRLCEEGKNFDYEERNCVDENTYNCYLPRDVIGKSSFLNVLPPY